MLKIKKYHIQQYKSNYVYFVKKMKLGNEGNKAFNGENEINEGIKKFRVN